ncbi:50S ribosomal protein L3 N(5)-glutamine methyltransferase [Stagnimonas aquatica]|uniref:50S ribosomal protein L3 N(5)-glutamine methyltransferase n=1 Tax=Stagnimonas aquatica TaxID=2689987 RepID=A0A3N0UZA6_9GAMM|nr:50S ribosomal protein L3 N(5)-glutamine methyltransferase [Stagnimonas aquatica]ROH85604.1 50S ribosomal protein L3 N(5)-glutamine methyltransferase [Stagnimonas aquatica]
MLSTISAAAGSPPPELHTVRDYVRWGASAFARAGLVYGHGTDNALDEAFHLVLWALKLPADLPTVYLEAALTAEEKSRVYALLRERIDSRRPAAYLIGEIQFCGLPFTVDERVLIPRSPIGEMIGQGFQPWLTVEPQRILDLCAGSGCIGIACAQAFPEAEVDLGELSEGALEVCEINILRHHCGGQVRAIKSDLFAAFKGRRYELIVSNPPYVPEIEVDNLGPEFQHEPRMALAAGIDGMDIVERILNEAAEHLSEGGLLVCEIGGSQEEFNARFPDIPVAWPEFERGGDGVFVIGKADLEDWLQGN